MRGERFHIGQTSVGNEPMGPNEAHVVWTDDSGREVKADFGEAELVAEIASWKARGDDATVLEAALAELLKHPGRRP